MLKKKEPQPRDCDRCGKNFASVSNLIQHKNRIHGIYKCDQCDFRAFSADYLSWHRKKWHGPFECKFCEFKSNNKKSFLTHKSATHKSATPKSAIHGSITIYECNQCNFKSVHKGNVVRHKRRKHGDQQISSGHHIDQQSLPGEHNDQQIAFAKQDDPQTQTTNESDEDLPDSSKKQGHQQNQSKYSGDRRVESGPRGARPKKSKNQESVIKRPRGRPRLNGYLLPLIRRPRGRPRLLGPSGAQRKKPTPLVDRQQIQSIHQAAQGNESKSPGDLLSPSGKRPRGRPRIHPIGRPRIPVGPPKIKRPVGRPRIYPIESQPKSKRPDERSRVYPIGSQPKGKRPRGRPRIYNRSTSPPRPRKRIKRGDETDLTSESSYQDEWQDKINNNEFDNEDQANNVMKQKKYFIDFEIDDGIESESNDTLQLNINHGLQTSKCRHCSFESTSDELFALHNEHIHGVPIPLMGKLDFSESDGALISTRDSSSSNTPEMPKVAYVKRKVGRPRIHPVKRAKENDTLGDSTASANSSCKVGKLRARRFEQFNELKARGKCKKSSRGISKKSTKKGRKKYTKRREDQILKSTTENNSIFGDSEDEEMTSPQKRCNDWINQELNSYEPEKSTHKSRYLNYLKSGLSENSEVQSSSNSLRDDSETGSEVSVAVSGDLEIPEINKSESILENKLDSILKNKSDSILENKSDSILENKSYSILEDVPKSPGNAIEKIPAHEKDSDRSDPPDIAEGPANPADSPVQSGSTVARFVDVIAVEIAEYSNTEIPNESRNDVPDSSDLEMPNCFNTRVPEYSNTHAPEDDNIDISDDCKNKLTNNSNMDIPKHAKLEIPDDANEEIPDYSNNNKVANDNTNMDVPVIFTLEMPNASNENVPESEYNDLEFPYNSSDVTFFQEDSIVGGEMDKTNMKVPNDNDFSTIDPNISEMEIPNVDNRGDPDVSEMEIPDVSNHGDSDVSEIEIPDDFHVDVPVVCQSDVDSVDGDDDSDMENLHGSCSDVPDCSNNEQDEEEASSNNVGKNSVESCSNVAAIATSPQSALSAESENVVPNIYDEVKMKVVNSRNSQRASAVTTKSRLRYQCEHCPFKSKFEHNFLKHTRHFHGDLSTVKSHQQGHVGVNSKNSQRAAATVNDKSAGLEYQCEHCPFKSKYRANFLKHSRLLHGCHPAVEGHQQCHQNEVKSKSQLSDVATPDGSILDEPIEITPSSVVDINELNCEQCDYKTSKSSNLRKHVYRMHVNVDNHKCEHCDFTTIHKKSYLSHVSRHNQMSTHSQMSKRSQVSKDYQYHCKHCDFRTNQKLFLLRHTNNVHRSKGKYLKCKYCQFMTLWPQCLNKHQARKHGRNGLPLYECEICEYKSPHAKALRKHNRTARHKKQLQDNKKSKMAAQLVQEQSDGNTISAGTMVQTPLQQSSSDSSVIKLGGGGAQIEFERTEKNNDEIIDQENTNVSIMNSEKILTIPARRFTHLSAWRNSVIGSGHNPRIGVTGRTADSPLRLPTTMDYRSVYKYFKCNNCCYASQLNGMIALHNQYAHGAPVVKIQKIKNHDEEEEERPEPEDLL